MEVGTSYLEGQNPGIKPMRFFQFFFRIRKKIESFRKGEIHGFPYHFFYARILRRASNMFFFFKIVRRFQKI